MQINILQQSDKYKAEACTKQNGRTKKREMKKDQSHLQSQGSIAGKGEICAGFLKMSKGLTHWRKFISGKNKDEEMQRHES